MVLRRLSGLILLAGLLLHEAVAHEIWSRVQHPAPGPAEVIGFYSAGCIGGAQVLPPVGEGYQVMRLSRNRHYGHPELVDFLQRLGRAAAIRGVRLLIGDLGQPRGGPMNYGHRSHQTGLDADIWFTVLDRHDQLPGEQIEALEMLSVVDRTAGRLRPERWQSLYADILRWVAQAPEVNRIFVNPVIKQALCRDPAQHGWLNKVRPWWGHDAHFHVRLACPTDSPNCQPQQPPPPGSGCDADLDNWVEEQRQPPRPGAASPPAPVVLSAACNAVLQHTP